jgi:hypothetical protein
MSHGHTRIPSKGACIYCQAKNIPLTDEHVVPLSLGGQHILCEASCRACADITKKFEQDVAREMWGDARNSYNAPSRRKKLRKTHILLSDPDNPERKVKVPYSEYPAAMVFYKMDRAGLLEGMPENVDLSAMWQFSAVCDDLKAKHFEQRFGIKLTARFRNVPESFARLLAKIAYCHTLCALNPEDFREICVPYILGQKSNPSYIVGGTFEVAKPVPNLGYNLNTITFGTTDKVMLMAEIRLFSNTHSPTYHVVVGDVTGKERVTSALAKLDETKSFELSTGLGFDQSALARYHWAPRVWPLPFWSQ